jgi:hypothetical protein
MAVKKTHVISPKKSDAKKEKSKIKAVHSKKMIPKKRNEFGDNDAF